MAPRPRFEGRASCGPEADITPTIRSDPDAPEAGRCAPAGIASTAASLGAWPRSSITWPWVPRGAGRCERAGARTSAQRLPRCLDGIASLSPAMAAGLWRRRCRRSWSRGKPAVEGIAGDAGGAADIAGHRELAGSNRAQDRLHVDPGVARSVCRRHQRNRRQPPLQRADPTSSAPDRPQGGPATSTTWPPARIRSGADCLPISVITPRGQMVHCHQTLDRNEKLGWRNPDVAEFGEGRRLYSPSARSTSASRRHRRRSSSWWKSKWRQNAAA